MWNNWTHFLCCTYLSESRKGQMSGTGGVEGRSFASAMMCSKVMSVWVHTSTTWISWGGPWGRPLGVRLMTCTTTGSLAARKASTVSSWLDLDNSFPFTWGQGHILWFDCDLFFIYCAFPVDCCYSNIKQSRTGSSKSLCAEPKKHFL